MDPLGSNITGWGFIASSAMMWAGLTFLPHRIGIFLKPTDFAAVNSRLLTWIWLYRFHLFGYLVAIMALVAFATLVGDNPARVVIWPGVAVCASGLMVSALAHAFYYHFGAWGAVDTQDKSDDDVAAFVQSLHPSNEYVTCLLRFGRVFFGLGQVVFGLGLWYAGTMPMALAIGAIVLGVAAMALTMGLPDNLEYYAPVFHLNAAWLFGMGLITLF